MELGFGFQLSDRFSVRPLFKGFAQSEVGSSLTLGLDLRYELTQRRTLAPYLLGTVTYDRNSIAPFGKYVTESVFHSGNFGVGLGVRQPLSKRWAVFGEVSIETTTAIRFIGGPWGQIPLGDRSALQLGFGVTFNLKK